MPCDDLTEVLELVLDANERLESFTLRKLSCGTTVGSGRSLFDFVAGRPASALLGCSLAQLLPAEQPVELIDEFMLAKQLAALQLAVAVYLGGAAGGLGETFVVESIDFDGERTRIAGLVRVCAPGGAS